MSNWRFLLIVVLLGVITYSLLTWNGGISTFAISISPDGEMAMDGAPLAMSELDRRIEAALADGDKVVVTIQASPDSPAGYVVDLLNAAQAAGATEVNIESTTIDSTTDISPGQTN